MYKHGEFLTVENYHTFKEKMESFDLLMFRGDDIISDAIAEIQTDDQFSHTGLVIHPNLLPGYNLEPDRLYVFESTYSYNIEGMDNGPPDYITGERFFGVQIRDLETVCTSYLHNDKTKISWFALKRRPHVANFVHTFTRYHRRPFLSCEIVPVVNLRQITPDIMLMAKSIINATIIRTILQSSFSCVNLVTSIYIDLGLISAQTSILYPIELLHLT